jgi:2-oxo-3-hexenedioate decarboxylase
MKPVTPLDPATLSTELLEAYRTRQVVAPPTSRAGGLDLATAYAVEAATVRARAAAGHRVVGLKVGFANKAAWRILKLETLVWAHMYDDTVRHADRDVADLPVGSFVSPKIEPEIVFRMKTSPPMGGDALTTLHAVEWIALGFEIIDCVFPEWAFQPADFVAAGGLHARLVVGPPLAVGDENRSALAEALASFSVRLDRNGEPVATGSGRNALRSPALCLAELATTMSRSGTRGLLAAGELVSSGTLTESQPIASGEAWSAHVEGLPLPPLSVRTIP